PSNGSSTLCPTREGPYRTKCVAMTPAVRMRKRPNRTRTESTGGGRAGAAAGGEPVWMASLAFVGPDFLIVVGFIRCLVPAGNHLVVGANAPPVSRRGRPVGSCRSVGAASARGLTSAVPDLIHS